MAPAFLDGITDDGDQRGHQLLSREGGDDRAVGGDPLTDVRVLKKVEFVMARGEVIESR